MRRRPARKIYNNAEKRARRHALPLWKCIYGLSKIKHNLTNGLCKFTSQMHSFGTHTVDILLLLIWLRITPYCKTFVIRVEVFCNCGFLEPKVFVLVDSVGFKYVFGVSPKVHSWFWDFAYCNVTFRLNTKHEVFIAIRIIWSCSCRFNVVIKRRKAFRVKLLYVILIIYVCFEDKLG